MAYVEGEVPTVVQGGGYGNGGFFGGDGIWAILLFALIFNGGWGGNWGGMGAGNNMLYDINANTNRGFDQAAVVSGLNGIQSSLSDASVARCNSTTTLLQAINSGFANTSSAFQNCCCENRLGLADLKYTVATENCADRQALNEGVRDIIASNTANTQAILDKLCQQEIDAKNTEIANLRTQVNMQNLAASQTAQTAALIADNNAQTRDLINRIAPYPQPSFLVGNPYYYGYNNGCGCSSIQ